MPFWKFGKKSSKASKTLAQGPVNMKILVPFYVYPNIWEENSPWKVLAASAKTSSVPIIAIVNPNSGPGDEVNSDYVEGIKILKEAGIEVIGYIHTQYGERPMDLVRADMAKWEQFYNIEGVFIDECASQHIHVSHYRNICDHCRDHNAHTIILNPGIEPTSAYLEICTAVVTFENYAKEWSKQVVGGDNSKCSVLLHTCPSVDEMKRAVDKMADGRYGYVYVTNDEMPNPWDVLPSYWSEFLAYVAEKASA